MALYTAFLGSLRPGAPNYDGTNYFYPIYVDVVILDSNSVALPVNDGGTAWTCFTTIFSTEAIVAGDTLATLRIKAMNAVRGQFPQIQPTDLVKAVWLDSGGLLSL